MNPRKNVEVKPVFAHERTELFQKLRELHMFGAHLEAEDGKARPSGILTRMGLFALLSATSAAMAASERARARHLKTLGERLGRFACTIRVMGDRGEVAGDAVQFAYRIIDQAAALMVDYDLAVRSIESDVETILVDPETMQPGSPANDEQRDVAPAVGAPGAIYGFDERTPPQVTGREGSMGEARDPRSGGAPAAPPLAATPAADVPSKSRKQRRAEKYR
jgi:hypothetical protein